MVRRRLAVAIGALALVGSIAAPSAAWAAPTTQIVQGDVLRLVSVADWAAASSLRPGVPVQWDVAVSADAPDPGTVRIAVSATGDASLRLDISQCATAWQGSGCPGGAIELRSAWAIPRDGAEVPLTAIADTEVAHIRLAITLEPADANGSTEVRVHAQGAGESAVVGPGGGLATTGLPATVPWLFGGGMLAATVGVLLVVVRRRRSESRTDPS